MLFCRFLVAKVGRESAKEFQHKKCIYVEMRRKKERKRDRWLMTSVFWYTMTSIHTECK